MCVQQVGQVGPREDAELLAFAAASPGTVVEHALALGGSQDRQAGTDHLPLACG